MLSSGFVWILLACVVYGGIHSLLASRHFKRWVMRRTGEALYRRAYRLFFSGMAVVTAIPLLALAALLPDHLIYRIPTPWVTVTLLLQGAALLALLAGVLQTGALAFIGLRQLTAPDATQEKLVVSGLYRWVRHPLYSASFVLLWLTPQMTWNTLALNLGLSAYLWIGSIFEERKLEEQFGAAYADYRQRTPRILPKFW